MSDIIELFKCSESSDHRTLYYDIQERILDAIKNDDLPSVKGLASVIEEVNGLINEEIIETSNQFTKYPLQSQDLVTVACKHGSLETLNFILENGGYFFRQVYRSTENIPSISAGEHHNCFYYAMRANNLDILNLLLHSFPSSYYIRTLQELDQILGETYEELKIKRVPLTPQIEFTIEKKIIDIRFYNEYPEEARQMQFETIEKRIIFLLKIIEMLNIDQVDNGKTSEKDLLILKYVVFNVHVLKRQLKNSYDQLPWEEIEFSVIIFIYSHQKKDPNNLFYTTVMSSHKIMKHLNNFAKKLKSLVNIFKKTSPLKKLFQSVRSQRETIVAKIVTKSPEFSELYEDFQRIRDVYSLQQMSDAVDLAAKARPQVAEEKLVIIRALQVLGECMKNTLDSPRLSNSLSEFLIVLAPTNTKEIITTLRDSLSHVDSLNLRLEIENNSSEDYFLNLQDDIKKLGNVIASTLHNNKDRLLKELLSTIITDDASAIMKHNQTSIITAAQEFRENIFLLEKPFKIRENDVTEMLVQKLKNMMSEKTDNDSNAFRNIDAILNLDEINTINQDMNNAFNNAFAEYILPIKRENARTSAYVTKVLKHSVDGALRYHRQPQKNLKSIIKDLLHLTNSFCSKHEDDEGKEFVYIVSSLVDKLQSETEKIEWIESLKGRLHRMKSKKPPLSEKQNEAVEKPNSSQLFNSKMLQLQTFLKDPLFDFTRAENLIQYKENLLHQSIIDMFLLDILSLLGEVGKLLPDNVITSIDDNTCLLNGRNLRNHIAHFNTYTEVFPSSTSGAVIINAFKFISDQVPFDCRKKLGKMQKSDPQGLQNKFKREMDFVELQVSMFEQIDRGDLEGLLNCVSQGADIYSRNINMMTAIHYAAKGTSLDIVEYLVTQNIDVSLKDSDGCGALHIAAMHGRVHTAEYLLTAVQLDVNALNNKSETALHIATMHGRHEIVKILLQANADIYLIDIGCLLPIHYAIVNNHIDIAELLIEHYQKANLQVLEIYMHPLHMAIIYGHIKIVELLLKKGCDVNGEKNDKFSPLQIAAMVGNFDVVRTLIQYGAQMKEGRNLPLTFAVESGNIEVIRFFLENGGNPNICLSSEFYNVYPLHTAIEQGSTEVISLLIHYQADVNAADSRGFTALHRAAVNGNKEFVEILLQNKALVNIQSCMGCTPLHFAALKQHIEIVETLIRNNASVNIGDCKNITPLTLAAQQGHLEIVKILLANGGHLNQYSVDGCTPLHYSIQQGHKKLSNFLISQGTTVITYSGHFPVLHMAAISGDAEVTKLLLAVGINVDEVDKQNGSTALGVATSYGNKNVIAVLLEHGADIDAVDYYDKNPLFIAARNNHAETCKFLLEKGASIKIIASITKTLKAAIFHNNFEIVESLIKNRAEVNEDSLEYAIQRGNVHIINLLLQNITCKLECPHLLCTAVSNGNQSLVESLLRLGVDCNSTYSGASPIMYAVEMGNAIAAKLLISHGADVNKISDEGDTALHLAIQKGHSHFVNLLLVNGIDISKTNKQGKRAIDVAISRLSDEFKETLANDIIKFKKSYGEWSLLNLPELRERCYVVQLLLDFGADTKQFGNCSWDPLQLAIHKERRDVIGTLLNPQKNLDSEGEDFWFIVHYAVHIGNFELLECILHHKVNVDTRDPFGSTALHMACRNGDWEAFRFLLKSGATYNSVNLHKQNPQDVATNIEITQVLSKIDDQFIAVTLCKDVNYRQMEHLRDYLNAKDHNGKTLLHYSIMRECHELTQYLLGAEVNCNAVDSAGKTPLHHACERNDFSTIISLFCRGAIYNKPDNNAKTPVQYARESVIIRFFSIVEKSFLSVKNNVLDLIPNIYALKGQKLLKALFNVRDEENNSIVITALKSDLPETEELKTFLFNDDSTRLAKIKELLREDSQADEQNELDVIIQERMVLLGKDHPWVWEVQKLNAQTLIQKSNYEDAFNLLMKIFEKEVELFGPINRRTLHTLSFIASVYLNLEQNEVALKLCRHTHNMQVSLLGKDHKNSLKTQITLAAAAQRLGNYSEALSNYYDILEILEVNEEDLFQTIPMLQNVAICFSNKGKPGEALKTIKDVLNIHLVAFSPEDYRTLRTLNIVASIHFHNDQYILALKIYIDILNIQESTLGRDHPDTLLTFSNIGNVYTKLNNFKKAFEICTEAKLKLDLLLGGNSPLGKVLQENIETIQFNLKLDKQTVQSEIFRLICGGDINSVKMMLDNEIDINFKDSEGRTPLYHAVSINNTTLTTALLANGADVTKVSNEGFSALHIAVTRDYREMVNILLDHAKLTLSRDVGRFINAQNLMGRSALHIAVQMGHLEIVNELLKNEAIYNCTDKCNHTPLFYSTSREISDILNLIENAFEYALKGNLNAVKELERNNVCDVDCLLNAQNCEGVTLKQLLMQSLNQLLETNLQME